MHLQRRWWGRKWPSRAAKGKRPRKKSLKWFTSRSWSGWPNCHWFRSQVSEGDSRAPMTYLVRSTIYRLGSSSGWPLRGTEREKKKPTWRKFIIPAGKRGLFLFVVVSLKTRILVLVFSFEVVCSIRWIKNHCCFCYLRRNWDEKDKSGLLKNSA